MSFSFLVVIGVRVKGDEADWIVAFDVMVLLQVLVINKVLKLQKKKKSGGTNLQNISTSSPPLPPKNPRVGKPAESTYSKYLNRYRQDEGRPWNHKQRLLIHNFRVYTLLQAKHHI